MNTYVDAATEEQAIESLKEIGINPEEGILSRLAHCEELWCFIPTKKEKENDD